MGWAWCMFIFIWRYGRDLDGLSWLNISIGLDGIGLGDGWDLVRIK